MPDADLMCVNHSFFGLEYLIKTGKVSVRHWVSLHPEYFSGFKKLHAPRTTTHSVRIGEGVDCVWLDFAQLGGSSGLLAVKIALELGYTKIALCGTPVDSTGRFYDHPAGGGELDDPAVKLAWENAKQSFGDKVKSYSGFTKEILGEPTEIWKNAR